MMLIELFHQLCDTIDMINSTFIFPMIFIVFNCLVSNMFSCFNIIWTFTKDFENFDHLILNEIPFLFFIYFLQSICAYSSCSMSSEATETSTIVIKAMSNPKCDRSSQELFKNFLIQHQCRNLKLQTCFFTLNWKLLLTVSFHECIQKILII